LHNYRYDLQQNGGSLNRTKIKLSTACNTRAVTSCAAHVIVPYNTFLAQYQAKVDPRNGYEHTHAQF